MSKPNKPAPKAKSRLVVVAESIAEIQSKRTAVVSRKLSLFQEQDRIQAAIDKEDELEKSLQTTQRHLQAELAKLGQPDSVQK